MRILLSLTHENIIDIKDFICEDSVDSLKDIYIIQVGFITFVFVTFTCVCLFIDKTTQVMYMQN